MSKKNNFQATGRRKTSVARINLVKGKGNILINGRSVDDYFGRDSTKMVMMQPLELTSSQKSYNININVSDVTANFAKAFKVSITNINEPPVDLGFESTIIENGLLMYLDATNPDSRGTNQWMDLSGNGNHANVNGATLVSDSYYSLDGND